MTDLSIDARLLAPQRLQDADQAATNHKIVAIAAALLVAGALALAMAYS